MFPEWKVLAGAPGLTHDALGNLQSLLGLEKMSLTVS